MMSNLQSSKESMKMNMSLYEAREKMDAGIVLVAVFRTSMIIGVHGNMIQRKE